MIIDIPEGHTRICGRSQGYLGLAVRDEEHRTALTDGRVFLANAMITRWQLTENERQAILAGEDVYVRCLGDTPAPMSVGVGDPKTYGW